MSFFNPDSFQLPNVTRLVPSFSGRANPPNIYNKVPLGWYKKLLKTKEGEVYPLTVAPAAVEKARIIYISGLNSTPTFFSEEIRPLQKLGISVYGLALPDPDLASGDLESHLKAPVEELFFGAGSPAFHGLKQNTPVYVVTHSTGGLITTDLSLDAQNREFFEENVSGFIHISPFFDTANASHEISEFSSAAYTGYSYLVGAIRSGVLPPDKIYYRMHKFPVDDVDGSSYKEPYHHQIRHLKQYGTRVYNELKARDADINYMPMAVAQSIIVGEADPCACTVTNERVADYLGAEFLPLSCMHNPLQQQFAEAISKIARDVSRCAPDVGDIDAAIKRFYRGPNLIPAMT